MARLKKYPTRLWQVEFVGPAFTSSLPQTVVAPSRGKALAAAWRHDVFFHLTFGEFLRYANCCSAPLPAWWCAPITVNGKPASYLGESTASVMFCLQDGVVWHSHPYDVLPLEYRPEQYRTRLVAA